MQIGELARSLGVSTKTLRYYESIGLLPSAVRSHNGYRHYSSVAIERAQLIVAMRRLEMPIEAITQFMLHEKQDGLRFQIVSLIDERLREYQLQISILQGKQEDLKARLDAFLRETPGGVTSALNQLLGRLGDHSASASKDKSRALTLP